MYDLFHVHHATCLVILKWIYMVCKHVRFIVLSQSFLSMTIQHLSGPTSVFFCPKCYHVIFNVQVLQHFSCSLCGLGVAYRHPMLEVVGSIPALSLHFFFYFLYFTRISHDDPRYSCIPICHFLLQTCKFFMISMMIKLVWPFYKPQ